MLFDDKFKFDQHVYQLSVKVKKETGALFHLIGKWALKDVFLRILSDFTASYMVLLDRSGLVSLSFSYVKCCALLVYKSGMA